MRKANAERIFDPYAAGWLTPLQTKPAVQYGVQSITVDGKALAGNVLPLAAAGTTVQVQVTMG